MESLDCELSENMYFYNVDNKECATLKYSRCSFLYNFGVKHFFSLTYVIGHY